VASGDEFAERIAERAERPAISAGELLMLYLPSIVCLLLAAYLALFGGERPLRVG
jgi:hypothetical protein